MPTGYTASVQDGTITTLQEYALSCARAFGATITMRDEPADAVIPDEFEPSPYHKDAIVTAKAKIDAWFDMTDLQRDEAYGEYCLQVTKDYEATIEKAQGYRDNYEAMLEKVEAWEAPTADHTNFRDFMLKQLRESIDFDCSTTHTKSTPMTKDDWVTEQERSLAWSLNYHQENWADEQKRCRERSKWVNDLRDSLT